jgi:arylsulfatase A-like enzyme
MKTPTRRRLVVAGISAAWLGAACDGSPTLPAESRSNPAGIVLVVIDTLRADHLDHYGYERATAAGLSRLHDQSTRFTHAYATAPWTAPSVASLLTGLSTARHATNAHGARLPEGAETLAEVLQARGWDTRAISFNVEVSRRTGFDQGFDDFDDQLGSVYAFPDAEEMVSRLEPWLAERDRRGAEAVPVFLYLQPMNAHGPYRVPNEHRGDLLGRAPELLFRYVQMSSVTTMTKHLAEMRQRVTPELLANLTDQYDTAIHYTSNQIGAVFELLDRHGLYDDTLIVVTSDHGEELFEHGGFSHGYSLHGEVLHVPLYVKLPGQTVARTVDTRVALTDIAPTLLAEASPETTASATSPRAAVGLDGRSFSELLRGPPPGTDEAADRVLLHETSWKRRCVARSIVLGDYKLIVTETDYEDDRARVELFDVSRDPGERADLSAQEPERVAQLKEELESRFRALESRALPTSRNVLDQLDQDRLRALGYADD